MSVKYSSNSSSSEQETDDSSYRGHSEQETDTSDEYESSLGESEDPLSNVSEERDEKELLEEMVEKQKLLRAKEKSSKSPLEQVAENDAVRRRLDFDQCSKSSTASEEEPPLKKCKKL